MSEITKDFNNMKTCYKCGKKLSLSQFCKDKTSKDGHHNRCFECAKQFYKQNKKRIYEQYKKRIRQRSFIRFHGVGLAYKHFLLASQDFECAICGRILKIHSGDACMDHCHKTGKIRGVLCRNCNMYLGQYGDNIIGISKGLIKKDGNKRLENAYNYLLDAF